VPGVSPIRRLRGEAGFTLPELLTTMWIAGVIMLAAFALVDFVMKRTAEAEQRVEATQRGRTGMDMITRQLRSQVCLAATPPIYEGTNDSITFYTDLGDSTASSLPERHTLTFVPGTPTGQITEAVEKPNATTPVTWQAPTTRVLITGITRDKDSSGNDIPIFQYRGFDNTKTPVQISTSKLAVPLKVNANTGKVAMVTISFRSVARRTPRSAVSFSIADDVYSRVINPNPPEQAPANFTPSPSCN
jgi:prepilin-type N-terminal cleavage/methylation domain-containing protein